MKSFRLLFFFFFSSRRRHTRCSRDWSSDVCSSDLTPAPATRRRGLLTVSHLTPHKNHAAVIRAAGRLEPKTTVRIIGRGPERASLERLAATLGVACSIESDLTETDMVINPRLRVAGAGV